MDGWIMRMRDAPITVDGQRKKWQCMLIWMDGLLERLGLRPETHDKVAFDGCIYIVEIRQWNMHEEVSLRY